MPEEFASVSKLERSLYDGATEEMRVNSRFVRNSYPIRLLQHSLPVTDPIIDVNAGRCVPWVIWQPVRWRDDTSRIRTSRSHLVLPEHNKPFEISVVERIKLEPYMHSEAGSLLAGLPMLVLRCD